VHQNTDTFPYLVVMRDRHEFVLVPFGEAVRIMETNGYRAPRASSRCDLKGSPDEHQ